MENTFDIDKIAAELAGGLSLDQLREMQGKNPYETRFEPTPTVPITERGKEHLKRISAGKTVQQAPTPRQLAKEMDYNDARRAFWRIMEERANEISEIEKRVFNWEISQEMSEIIKNMIRYFINDESCAYKLNKGLFLCGMPGTGKSEMVAMFSKFCRENKLSKEFEITSFSQVHIRAKTDKDFDPIAPIVQFNRCFDEFGRHIGPIVRFGDSLNINEAVLEERYERHKRYGQITHLVSNMTPHEVQEAFPPMILDRIKSMCASVVFPGKSKRI